MGAKVHKICASQTQNKKNLFFFYVEVSPACLSVKYLVLWLEDKKDKDDNYFLLCDTWSHNPEAKDKDIRTPLDRVRILDDQLSGLSVLSDEN